MSGSKDPDDDDDDDDIGNAIRTLRSRGLTDAVKKQDADEGTSTLCRKALQGVPGGSTGCCDEVCGVDREGLDSVEDATIGDEIQRKPTRL